MWWAPGTCSVRGWDKRSQKKTWAKLTNRKLGPNIRCTVAREKGKGMAWICALCLTLHYLMSGCHHSREVGRGVGEGAAENASGEHS